jgi:transposase
MDGWYNLAEKSWSILAENWWYILAEKPWYILAENEWYIYVRKLTPVTGRTVNVIHRCRNNVGFRRLLAAISRAYDLPSHPERKVVLFIDNDRAHKAKRIHELLERHGHQIQIEWLPPYSPELNPQEDVWQDLRRCVTHNHYFEHVDELLEAVQEFHQQLESNPERVLRLLRKWARLISA